MLTWDFDSRVTPRDSASYCDPAGGYTQQVRDRDHRDESLPDPTTAFEEPAWEATALP